MGILGTLTGLRTESWRAIWLRHSNRHGLWGRPPCTAFSRLNTNWNFPKMPPELVKAKLAEGRRHLHFVVGLYHLQLSQGRHFLHEHPDGATSWKDPWVLRLLAHPRVRSVVSDQCEYGLVTHGLNGEFVAAKKPTRWATSSIQMCRRLSTRCNTDHTHQPLLSGRAAQAAFYPLPLQNV